MYIYIYVPKIRFHVIVKDKTLIFLFRTVAILNEKSNLIIYYRQIHYQLPHVACDTAELFY